MWLRHGSTLVCCTRARHLINICMKDTYASNKFLPPPIWNSSGNFNGHDSRELYEKNLESQPSDWYYRHNAVTYTLNSERYRAPEFDTIDWANSVVIFGCSTVFGTAVDDKHTISSQLSQLISRPVVNLGVAASSIQLSTFNSAILAGLYPTPAAVVHLWTQIDRCMHIDNGVVKNFGPWNLTANNYMDQWMANSNSTQSARMHREISQQLWKDRTAYYEATVYPLTADVLDCTLLPLIDQARDFYHPGIKTTAMIAAHLAENLTL